MDLEEYLRQFQVRGPDASLRERVLPAAPKTGLWRTRRWFAWAAAAAVLVVVGGYAWQGAFVPRPVVPPTDIAKLEPASILDGRGRILPVSQETRFTLIDAAAGHVRLEQGEVFVECPADGDVEVKVQTPVGTATARCPFLAHCEAAPASGQRGLLAVAALGGSVVVSNGHGRVVADVGEVVLAPVAEAPERHSSIPQIALSPLGASAAGTGHHACPFVSGLALIYRADVQAELKLTGGQRARLLSPAQEDLRSLCAFFRGLRDVPRTEWRRRATEFCQARQDRLDALLTVEQRRRLRQISLQQEGIFALVRPEVSGELQLSSAQRAAVQKALRDFGKEYKAILATASLVPADRGPQVETLQRETTEQIFRSLSAEQQLLWLRLLGEPFPLIGIGS